MKTKKPWVEAKRPASFRISLEVYKSLLKESKEKKISIAKIIEELVAGKYKK